VIKQATYIKAYCSIQNNKIDLNGTSVFKTGECLFVDFAKAAYRNFELNYPKFFKMDNLSKLAFLAAELLLKNELETDRDIALLLSNKSSSLDTDIKFQESINNQENYFPSPAVFVYTLPNICMGEISIRHNLKSENTFFIFEEFNPGFMSNYTNVLLCTNRAEEVLCGWVEYYKDTYRAFLYIVTTTFGIPHDATTIQTLFNK
jgi:hypothetical protein